MVVTRVAASERRVSSVKSGSREPESASAPPDDCEILTLLKSHMCCTRRARLVFDRMRLGRGRAGVSRVGRRVLA